jgi:hypothetical protein
MRLTSGGKAFKVLHEDNTIAKRTNSIGDNQKILFEKLVMAEPRSEK